MQMSRVRVQPRATRDKSLQIPQRFASEAPVLKPRSQQVAKSTAKFWPI